jgi:hypothetical protein
MKLLPALRVPGDTEAARATGCSVRLSGSIVCQRGTGIASDIPSGFNRECASGEKPGREVNGIAGAFPIRRNGGSRQLI